MTKDTILNTILTDDQAALFYLGQEGFLIKYRGQYLLIDPYLSDYTDQNCCSETVKWVRKYDAPIHAAELDFVDYVLCTHMHFDHADPYTLESIAKCNKKAVFIAPEAVKDTLSHYAISPERISGAVADISMALGAFSVIPLPAAHEELHQDEHGNYLELGYKVLCGNLCICHVGDCCIYDGLAERLRSTDILLVPINGRSYYKLRDDIIGNMTAEEAVILAKEVHAGMIIPMHFDLYEANGLNPAHFVDILKTINPTQRFHIFAPGECYIR